MRKYGKQALLKVKPKAVFNSIMLYALSYQNYNLDAVLLTGAAAAGVAGRLIAAASLYCTNGAPMLQYRTIGGMIGVYDLELSIMRSNENFG